MTGRIAAVTRVIAVNLALVLAILVALELIFGAWFSAIGFSPVRISRDVRIVFDAQG